MTDSEAPISAVAGALSREHLHGRIVGADRPLVRDLRNVEDQLQPNGIDLTLQSVSRHMAAGAIGVSNVDRRLPDLQPLAFDDDGWIDLEAGIYHIVYNEIVDIPADLMALGRPRSSLGRSGVTIHTAVWDAGYTGRSTSLLSVLNPAGFRIQRDARVMQLVFFGLSAGTGTGYDGQYLHENV